MLSTELPQDMVSVDRVLPSTGTNQGLLGSDEQLTILVMNLRVFLSLSPHWVTTPLCSPQPEQAFRS